PCGESDHDATQYIDRSVDPAAGYCTISKSIGEFKTEVIAQPLGWGEMHGRDRAFSNAEKDRLLDLAATRPKQMLVICLYPDQPAKCPWTPLIDGMDFARELDVPAVKPGQKTELTKGPDLSELEETRRVRLDAIR